MKIYSLDISIYIYILRRKDLKTLCKNNNLSYKGDNLSLFNRLCKNNILEKNEFKNIIIKLVREKPVYIFILKKI